MPAVAWRTEGAITRLTLTQPEKLNALGEDTAAEFAKAVAAIAKEPSKVVVLTGEGKAFCAGGDLAFIEANRKHPRASLPSLMRRFYGSFLSLRSLPQVTLAQVNGAAVGAGLCLALACDLRTVLADARLGFNFVRLGLNAGMGAWPLARSIFGESRARELLFAGRFFTGRDLTAWGGAAACERSPEALSKATEELALEIAGHSRQSLRWLKKETALDDPLEQFLALEARGQADCFKGADIAEGVAAVRQRRAPRFK